MESLILTEKQDDLLLIGFNRPEARNLFTTDMIQALSDAYTLLERDPALRCGVIYAKGMHFTLGLQLDEVAPKMKANRGLTFAAGNIDPWGISGPRRTKPVVIAAHGFCFTLGIELMLAGDINLAAPKTTFAQIEVSRGIMPFGGATVRMVQAFGWGNAMRLLLTGEPFSADEAYRVGLIQEIVEKNALLPRAVELARKIAAQAPLAVQATLHSAHTARHAGEAAAFEQLVPESLRLMETNDAEEGLRSFVEKRPPRFTGN